MTTSNLSDFFNFVDETTNYNYESYKCQNWYLVDGIKCFVTALVCKGVEPIAQSDDLKAYDIKHFIDFARQYNLSESEANEYHVTDYEENDYTKVIPFGSVIELTQIDYQGLDDDNCAKIVWRKASVNNNSVNNINNANDLIDALVTYNSDPYLIEDEEQAQEVFDSIESNGLELIANPTNEDLEKLNLTAYNKVKALYSFGEGLICLDGDWEM